jgi:hypothetical protein
MKFRYFDYHALWAALIGAVSLSAAARPGTPTNVEAIAVSPTQVEVHLTNTAEDDEEIWIEVEQTTNGVRIPPHAEAELSVQFNSPSYVLSLQFRDGRVEALPETDYCFRAWARDRAGILSELPSGWACTRTPPYPPLAPLDVKAELEGHLDETPRVSWSLPDQSGSRGIEAFVVERQSPPGENRPWIHEQIVPRTGEGARAYVNTRLTFDIEGSRIDRALEHVYRICSRNEGGLACATAPLVGNTKLVGAAETRPHDDYDFSVAPPEPLNARTGIVEERRGNVVEQTGTVEAIEIGNESAVSIAERIVAGRTPTASTAILSGPLPPRDATVLEQPTIQGRATVLTGGARVEIARAVARVVVNETDALLGNVIQVKATGPLADNQWLALAKAGSPDAEYVEWTWVAKGGSFDWAITPALPGAYELRLLDIENKVLARSAVVTVTTPRRAGTVAELRPSPDSVAPRSPASVLLSGGPGGARDWIGFYRVGAEARDYIAYVYVGVGVESRSWTVTAPEEPGQYEFRFFLDNSYDVNATSGPVIVEEPTGTTVTIDRTAPLPGEPIIVAVRNGWRGAKDWIAVARTNDPKEVGHHWTYVGDGIANRDWETQAPLNPGTYEVRLFRNGHVLIAKSAPFTIE